jgi:hypothetical protein
MRAHAFQAREATAWLRLTRPRATIRAAQRSYLAAVEELMRARAAALGRAWPDRCSDGGKSTARTGPPRAWPGAPLYPSATDLLGAAARRRLCGSQSPPPRAHWQRDAGGGCADAPSGGVPRPTGLARWAALECPGSGRPRAPPADPASAGRASARRAGMARWATAGSLPLRVSRDWGMGDGGGGVGR